MSEARTPTAAATSSATELRTLPWAVSRGAGRAEPSTVDLAPGELVRIDRSRPDGSGLTRSSVHRAGGAIELRVDGTVAAVLADGRVDGIRGGTHLLRLIAGAALGEEFVLACGRGDDVEEYRVTIALAAGDDEAKELLSGDDARQALRRENRAAGRVRVQGVNSRRRWRVVTADGMVRLDPEGR
jgi:hypothetical protein